MTCSAPFGITVGAVLRPLQNNTNATRLALVLCSERFASWQPGLFVDLRFVRLGRLCTGLLESRTLRLERLTVDSCHERKQRLLS